MVQRYQKQLLSLLALTIVLGACSKGPSLDPVGQQDLQLVKKLTARYYSPIPLEIPPSAGQVITYQTIPFYFLSQLQTSYQYDDQKRLIRQEAAPPNANDPIEDFGASYAYDGNKLVYTHLRSQQSTAYLLNQQGYISEQNTYDPDGYLTRHQQALDVTTTQTVLEGNIAKRIDQDQLGRRTTTYEYDLTKNGFLNPGILPMGRNSRNLLVKTSEIYESFTGMPLLMPDQTVTTYTYEFDQKGLVKQQTAYLENSFLSNSSIVSRELRISSFEFR